MRRTDLRKWWALGSTLLVAAATCAALLWPRSHRLSPAPTLTVSSETRLVIIAPHPDDEVLGAAGAMQHVVGARGAVLVIYLTDGEGFPEGVRAHDHVAVPTASDYRD